MKTPSYGWILAFRIGTACFAMFLVIAGDSKTPNVRFSMDVMALVISLVSMVWKFDGEDDE